MRDIKRDILKNVKGINLNENKLSINYMPYPVETVTDPVLPNLNYAKTGMRLLFLDYQITSHMGILVDYLKSAYPDTSQRIPSLLSTGNITYDQVQLINHRYH